ncbi:MAG: metallophosphoesterase [Chloroflexi bacterium]|nr:metallophosphoesterase [Chloroflexota bacterium]
MSEKEIIIFHTSDLHDRRDRLKQLNSLIRKNTDQILLDSGDAIGGSNTVFSFSEPVLDMMNDMGYTAMAIGNREFNYIRQVMKSRISQAGFPMLSANLEDLRGTLKDLFKPYIAIDREGLRIIITGLTPVQYPQDCTVEKIFGFRFHMPDTAINKIIAETGPANLLIILSHTGLKGDRELAESLAGKTPYPVVILGGHTHTVLEKPVSVGNILICHPGAYGKTAGRLTLRIEIDGDETCLKTYDCEILRGPE